jgi:crotonobetainyl-CoA:carnitine CoA-transferase CaiB-like acyl-CoA transferase
MAGATWEPRIAPMGYPRLLAPDRNPYRTKDGYLALLVYNDKQWRSFFAAIGRPELFDDERFSSLEQRSRHIADVYAYLAEVIATRTSAEWLELLGAADIPAMPIHDLDSLLDDPHLDAVGFFREVEHPSEGTIRVMDTPSRWSASPPSYRRHAPLLGEHSAEILGEAGYSEAEIESLVAEGVTALS